ncbi:MAG: sulfurtransferase TusA family protein [Terracidiphilus sp.]|jgi:tRNA 2-thiouridine synthesizing protein A
MEAKFLDAKGLKCPLPTLKMLTMAREMKPGEILEVVADCPSFETDVRKFCESTNRALLFVKAEGNSKRVQVRI